MNSAPREDSQFWRKLAGNPLMFDTMGGTQFGLLSLFFGLRESHKLLEVGSGCLRAARHLIPYLNPGHYCGVEPNQRAVALGLAHELGREMQQGKHPRFTTRTDYGFHEFQETFDFALAYSLLTHVPPRDIPCIFENLAKCFHQQSMFLATAFLQEEERIVDHENWTNLPINHYSFTRIQDAAKSVGMRVERIGKIHQDWFVAFYEGNEQAAAAAEEAGKINWDRLIPRWEQPANWGKSA